MVGFNYCHHVSLPVNSITLDQQCGVWNIITSATLVLSVLNCLCDPWVKRRTEDLSRYSLLLAGRMNVLDEKLASFCALDSRQKHNMPSLTKLWVNSPALSYNCLTIQC